MDGETNSNLDTFTEQTIFHFLLAIFSPRNTTKFAVLWNIWYFPEKSNFQYLAFKTSTIKTITQQILK